jgi:PAS domain S-box-containing protein
MAKTARTVLVIDGSPEDCARYRSQLLQDQTFTYQVLAESLQAKALQICQTQTLDGILLGLCNSPNPSDSYDFGVLDQLSLMLGEQCPPIVVVGGQQIKMAVQALKHGAADYLVRDQLTGEDLRYTLRSAIENAELKRQLQSSRERFHTSIENLMDCFGIFTALRDEIGTIIDFRIDYLNRAACENNRMSLEQQVDRGLCEVLPGHIDSGLFEAYCHLVETGEPLVKDSVIFEDSYGGGKQLVRAFDIRATRLNDGFVASWRDITDRKRLELELNFTVASLQQQQQRLKQLIEQAPVGIGIGSPDGEDHVIFAVDLTPLKQVEARLHDDRQLRRALDSLFSFVGMLTPNGILIDANRTALEAAGLELQDVVNRPFEETYWWSYSPQVQTQLRQAMAQAAQGEMVRYDVDVRVGDDDYITIDFALVPLLDAGAQVEYLVPSGIDITQRKRVEASLQESHNQLEQQLSELENIYQSAPIGLNVLDRDLRFVRINQLLAEINGLSVEEHIGRTVREVLPDLADTAEQMLRPILETGEPLLNVEIEGETPAQPGVKRTWLEHFLPLKQGDRVIGINTVCQEITNVKHQESESQQREAALQASETRFRILAETIQDVFWMTDFRIPQVLYISPAYEKIWGRPVEAIYQDSSVWLDTIHPDDRARIRAAREMITNQDFIELEYRIVRPDGEVRWIRDRGFNLRDESGEIQQTVGIAQDVTQQKQTELALRTSEERYRTLFETMEDGFCVIELLFDHNDNPVDYRFIELNPAFERHTGLHQAEGKTARQMLPDLEDHWFETYGRVALTGEPVRFENGSEVMNRWFEVYAFRLGGPESRKVALLFKDISDRKTIAIERERLLRQEHEAREAAERANRIKDEFLAILSHELRTPLNPILGWSKLLQTRQLDEAKTKRALTTIERNAKLQTQLIDDLLDVARILRGKLKLETQPGALKEVIEAALDTVRSSATAKSIHLHFPSPPSTPLQVSGDPGRLQQVIWNLFSNAIKFTPSGGQVEVTLEQVTGGENEMLKCDEFSGAGSQVTTPLLGGVAHASTPHPPATPSPSSRFAQISVTDTGQGISPEFLPHIFESFRQEDISITRQHGGLGLGLSIVRYLVEAHGGTITADSPGEGLGATFTVQLPLLPARSTSEATSMPPVQNQNLAGLRIMAVDDEADARSILEAILTFHDAEVRMATTAAEVLEQLAEFRPHVLICDLGMPSIDGYSLIHHVRNLPPEQGGLTPAIALTAYARDEDRQRTLNSGYQYHIAKPFDLEDLVQTVASLALRRT